MAAGYTAVIQQHGDWWIGWVEEVPGVNSQGGATREELLDNLRDAQEQALEMNRQDARAAASAITRSPALSQITASNGLVHSGAEYSGCA